MRTAQLIVIVRVEKQVGWVEETTTRESRELRDSSRSSKQLDGLKFELSVERKEE